VRGQSNPTTEHSNGKGEAPDQPGKAQADKGGAGVTPSKNQSRRRENLKGASAEPENVHFERLTSETTVNKRLGNSTSVGETNKERPSGRQEQRRHQTSARGSVVVFVHGSEEEGSRVRRDSCRRNRRAIPCKERGASRDTTRVKAGSLGGAHKSKGFTRSNSTPITRGSRLLALSPRSPLSRCSPRWGTEGSTDCNRRGRAVNAGVR
jgi:hypothetical protein